MFLLASACAESEDAPGGRQGTIAFVSFRGGDQEVYIVNADGRGERNFTNEPAADDFDPNLSPDGKRLAFVSNRTGQAQVYVADLPDGAPAQLTQDGGLAPRWSNDGRKIAYSAGGSIVVISMETGEETVVMESQQETQAALTCRGGAFPGGWSPDDSEIVYYVADATAQNGLVCSVGFDDAEAQTLVSEPGGLAVEPVWSPDGREIVYRAIIDGVHDIWVLDLDSGTRTNLTNSPDLDVEPDWSPDGQSIVFASLKQAIGHFDLYIVGRNGSPETRLTTAEGKDAYPSWAR